MHGRHGKPEGKIMRGKIILPPIILPSCSRSGRSDFGMMAFLVVAALALALLGKWVIEFTCDPTTDSSLSTLRFAERQ
jgi:hypothetical protein